MPEIIQTFTPLPTKAHGKPLILRTPTPKVLNIIRGAPISYGDVQILSPKVRDYIAEYVDLCKPDKIHIVDGTEDESKILLKVLQDQGTIQPLPKYENCWLARTNPSDVARVESKTFICTDKMEEAIPIPREGVKGQLGNWMSPEDYEKAVKERFPGCMKGRVMYVVAFSMGPIGSPLSKIGIELTDSPYVVCSMRIMARMGIPALKALKDNSDFVKCLHSVGVPANGKIAMPSWPCDPERTIILHKPAKTEIISYGSGYGGNSLLGKKCFALRIGCYIGKREGWMAEHMLILGITNPDGEKKYIAAAFPSACGKTNLAMLMPTIPGYKIECVGDDIAWMRFDEKGVLRAINPENGFFGVAPGTSEETNPNAMTTMHSNTIFTNVASTSDGGVYWEGMEHDAPQNVEITDWLGHQWKEGENKNPAAHPNSRFAAPVRQCPIIDPAWEDSKGVPISAILFGGRRPTGVPLVYEANSWAHGVFLGASMRSETTAAAEHKGKVVMHDPFAMRPFFGYNFGKYMQHWLDMGEKAVKLGGQPPKIFHVNWFRKSNDNKFLWPGFGDNIRVLDWVLQRIDDHECFIDTPIGRVPTEESLKLDGIKVNYKELFSIPKDFWLDEADEIRKYFDDQLPNDLPSEICKELSDLKERVSKMRN